MKKNILLTFLFVVFLSTRAFAQGACEDNELDQHPPKVNPVNPGDKVVTGTAYYADFDAPITLKVKDFVEIAVIKEINDKYTWKVNIPDNINLKLGDKLYVWQCEELKVTAIVTAPVNKPDPPKISVSAPSCSGETYTSGTVTLENYDSAATYSFTSEGVTVTNISVDGTTRLLSGYEFDKTYSVTATKDGSASDAKSFSIPTDNEDCDGDGIPNTEEIVNGTDPSNPCSPNQTTKPVIAFEQPSCDNGMPKSGSARITNYDDTVTYEITADGTVTSRVTVGTKGELNGLKNNITYVVSVTNSNCKVSSDEFKLDSSSLDCDGDGVPEGTDDDDKNPCVPNQTSKPEVTTVQPSCEEHAGSAIIGNYDNTVTYEITADGTVTSSVTVGTKGELNGLKNNITYVVSATNSNCKVSSEEFKLDSSSLDCDGDGVTDDVDPDDNNSCAPNGISKPEITTVQPSCEEHAGSAKITNYDNTVTYEITADGTVTSSVTVGTKGELSGLENNITYVVSATNSNCKVSSDEFKLDSSSLDCDGDGVTDDVDPDDNNSCAPNGISKPEVTTVQPSCEEHAGSAIIGNYDNTVTYEITADGTVTSSVTIGTNGELNGLKNNITYVVSATNSNCKVSSDEFKLDSSNIDCDGDGVTDDVDPDDSDSCVPNRISKPEVRVVPTECSPYAKGTITVSNYDASVEYTSTPADLNVGSGGEISGFTMGVDYTLTATKNGCSSTSASFRLETSDCDGDGVDDNTDDEDNNLCVPNGISKPEVTTVQPSCEDYAGSAIIRNYDSTVTYEITADGTVTNSVTVGTKGELSNLNNNITYVVSATKNNCKVSSDEFKLDSSNLDCDGDGVTDDVDPDDSNSCVPNGISKPEITTVQPSCEEHAGSAKITNYDNTVTYEITADGTVTSSVTVGTKGELNGLKNNITYVVSATNSNCKVSSEEFKLDSSSLDCDGDGVTDDVDPDDNNSCAPNGISKPEITTVQPSCEEHAGSATIGNYDSTVTYEITADGTVTSSVTVGTKGELNGLKNNITYVVSATNSNCKVSSDEFKLDSSSLDCDGDGVTDDVDPDDNNSCAPNGISKPEITTVQPSCEEHAGSAKITNYDNTVTYEITADGTVTSSVTVGTKGELNGLKNNITYVVSATNSNCKVSSDEFKLDSSSLDCDGDGVTDDVDPDDNNSCAPNGISKPEVQVVATVCEPYQKGVITLDNYDSSATYTSIPVGLTVGSGGEVSGFTTDVDYTLTATKNGCSSTSDSFRLEMSDCKSILPMVTEPTSGDKVVTGTGVPSSEIIVTLPKGGVVTTKVDTDGNWSIDIPSGENLNPVETIVVTQTEKNKRQSEAVTATVKKYDCDKFRKELEKGIPQFISPNGDSHNDIWEIPALNLKTNCNQFNKVSIFNRWGVKVWESENYSESDKFDGYSNHIRKVGGSNLLPEGTYYYVIKINDEFSLTGWLYIYTEKK